MGVFLLIEVSFLCKAAQVSFSRGLGDFRYQGVGYPAVMSFKCLKAGHQDVAILHRGRCQRVRIAAYRLCCRRGRLNGVDGLMP